MRHYTTGELAERWKVPGWRIRRVLRQAIPDGPKAGRYRLLPEDRLPELAAVLRGLGYAIPDDLDGLAGRAAREGGAA